MLEKDSIQPKLLASEAWVTPADGAAHWSRIRYPNDVTVARNGTVYFTDSSEVDSLLNEGGWYDTARSALMAMFQASTTVLFLELMPGFGIVMMNPGRAEQPCLPVNTFSSSSVIRSICISIGQTRTILCRHVTTSSLTQEK